MKLLILLLLINWSYQTLAQTAQLTGVVQDASTLEGLSFANVFINNTTLGTVANAKGEFLLANIPEGSSEIICSFVGYRSYQANMVFHNGEIVNKIIKLVAAERQLSTVEVKTVRDKEWESNIKKFQKIFLGQDAIASSCSILNPWVIDFVKSPGHELIAQASAPIEIVNMALGYKIYFHLKDFKASSKSYIISGNTQFEALLGDGKQAERWAENRKNVYAGSYQHLFRAIIHQRIRGEGFALYTDKPGLGNHQSRSALFYSDLDKTVVPYDTGNIVFPSDTKEQSRILLKGRIEIHYTNEYAQVKTYKDIPYPVSWMEVHGNYVVVNSLGIPYNPSDVITSGAMNSNRVSHMLPLDFNVDKVTIRRQPPRPPDLSQVEEKVYVHTDKPYYYPGEAIWFRGYMNYRTPSLSDSLSRVLYVELISPKRNIELSQISRIDNGFAKGGFVLPDTITPGNYFLRAYTQWMRNYGEMDFFVKPVTILNLNEKADRTMASQNLSKDSTVVIQCSRSAYHTREKIELKIRVKDSEGDPLASHLSISVTDAQHVIPIQDDHSIDKDFPWTSNADSTIRRELNYPLEHGITISGTFFNDKQKPSKAELSVVKGKFEDLMIVDVNRKGTFELNGLQFFDTAQFAFQAKNQKGIPFGKTVLANRKSPAADFKLPEQSLKSFRTESQQQIDTRFSEYKLRAGEILLQNVAVTAKKIKEEKKDTLVDHLMHGQPDYVIQGKDLTNFGPNLIVSLQGRVPGMQVYSMMVMGQNHYVVKIRGGKMSIFATSEPLVVVDGVIIGGQDRVVTADPKTGATWSTQEGDTAGDRLQNINPMNVERIEITTRLNSLYGLQGSNGVIAVFTKNGGASREEKLSLKSFDIFNVMGYSKPNDFLSPDYSNPATDSTQADYRSTIYWNPDVTTNSQTGMAGVSFYAADLKTRYRVVVEGVTEKGNPIRSEFYFDIN